MFIKIVESSSKYDLETKVNSLLEKLDESDIIDIKYCGETNHPPYLTDYNSVMIIMKGKKRWI